MSRYNLTLLVIFLVFLIGFIVFFITPASMEMVELYLSPGLGLKYSAVIAFFVTMVFLVVMALFAGDGFLGEIQFMIGSFFFLFTFFWFMIAWIF